MVTRGSRKAHVWKVHSMAMCHYQSLSMGVGVAVRKYKESADVKPDDSIGIGAPGMPVGASFRFLLCRRL
jgi:hypothetical protein